MTHALIVEDDVDSAQMMAALVASDNFTVATAHNLGDARRQLALQPPDIVLLDLQLPDGNGMSLFDDPELLSQSEVVLITGHASLDTSIQALRLGAADYLVKPVSPKQLHGILSRVMRPSASSVSTARSMAAAGQPGRLARSRSRVGLVRAISLSTSRTSPISVSAEKKSLFSLRASVRMCRAVCPRRSPTAACDNPWRRSTSK